MIRALYRSNKGSIQTDLTPADFDTALKDSRGLLWVDFVNEPAEACEPILRDTFGFHPLAVDDALAETHTPKIDDWDAYLYIVLRDIVYDQDADDLVTVPELDIFLGKNHIVTHHDLPVAAVDRAWHNFQQDHHYFKQSAGYLLYKLIDELVSDYLQAVESLDDTLDLIEDQLFDSAAPPPLENIFILKKALLNLRRIILPQSEVLNRLARDEYRIIDRKDRIFFRDVYDHFVRLQGLTENMREMVGIALNTYLSIVNNRMSDVMKTLTIFAALFMPLSFIVGFFGMNFFQAATPLDSWTNLPAFILTFTAILILPLGMYFWMRHRGWM